MNRSSANHLAIIKELYYLNNATCLDISKATGASIPNVAKNINELIEAGYIVQNGFATSTGGRKPLTYSLVSDRKYILSIATDQFFTRICLVDLHNNFLTDVYEFPLDLAVHASPERELVDQIESYLTQHRIDRTKIYGLGMAMPGFVSPDQGVNQTFFKAAKPNLQRFLATETGFDVFIDNDSSAIALAELKFGEGRVKNELMVINIGWGIGLGMIINGEIFRGSTGFAGEFSHIPLFKNGKKCSCGKYGCLETEASLIILEEKAHQQLEPGHGGRHGERTFINERKNVCRPGLGRRAAGRRAVGRWCPGCAIPDRGRHRAAEPVAGALRPRAAAAVVAALAGAGDPRCRLGRSEQPGAIADAGYRRCNGAQRELLVRRHRAPGRGAADRHLDLLRPGDRHAGFGAARL